MSPTLLAPSENTLDRVRNVTKRGVFGGSSRKAPTHEQGREEMGMSNG